MKLVQLYEACPMWILLSLTKQDEEYNGLTIVLSTSTNDKRFRMHIENNAIKKIRIQIYNM